MPRRPLLPRPPRPRPLHDYFFDARCWAALIFLAGLVSLDLPLHDDHSWRQGWGMMIARNFYRYGWNPLYPLSDICGEASPDYFATEFPLQQALAALVYRITGEQYWVGRLIVWATSCLGLWYFARLVGRLVGSERAGLYAMLVLTGSIAMTFARKLMPDSFSLFLTIIGTYYLLVYLEERHRLRDLLLGGGLVALGVLCKIPSVVIVTLLAVPYLRGRVPLRAKAVATAALGLAGALVAGWYFAWMPHLQEITACNPLIFPVSLSEGYTIVVEEMGDNTLFRFKWNAFYGGAPFLAAVLGWAYALGRGDWRLILASLAYSGLFFLFMLKTGHVFPTHSYYVIPYIPLMSLFAGLLLDQGRWLARRTSLWAAIALATTGVAVTLADTALQGKLEEVRLGPVLDSLGAPPDALVMFNGRWGEPTTMYYTGRRGWVRDNNHLRRYDWMPDYRSRGLGYIIQDRRRMPDTLEYPILYADDVWFIYDPGEVGDPLPEYVPKKKKQ